MVNVATLRAGFRTFLLLVSFLLIRENIFAASQIVECKSSRGKVEFCSTSFEIAGIYIDQLLSDQSLSCIQSENFGFDKNEIWVHGGCHARFMAISSEEGAWEQSDINRLNFKAHRRNFAERSYEFQELVEEILTWRAENINHIEQLVQRAEKDKPLPVKSIDRLHKVLSHYVDLRSRLFPFIEYSQWMVFNTEISINEQMPTWLGRPVQWDSKKNTFSLRKIRVNPMDSLGEIFNSFFRLSLSASLMAYDNYVLLAAPIFENDRLRKLLKSDHPTFSKEVAKIIKSFSSWKNRSLVKNGIGYYREFREKQTPISMEDEREVIAYLDTLISSSRAYLELADPSFFKQIKDLLNNAIENVTDFFSQFFSGATQVVSKWFGNSVGLIQFRSGKLKDLSQPEIENLQSQLQPGDILLEKTPFRLTDKFIPGYYGHIAIWTGSRDQLEDIGVWSQLSDQEQDWIQEGRQVIEALRPGVQINPLEKFLDIDDFLVLRLSELSEPKKAEYVLRAFEQIGKKYDFNFDIETDRRIVCSELVYVVYRDMDIIQWPVEKSLGRWTISPDHVAGRALDQLRGKNYGDLGPLEIVTMYVDGSLVDIDPLRKLDSLLEESYTEIEKARKMEKGRKQNRGDSRAQTGSFSPLQK